MSHREQEEGTLLLPASQAVAFRKTLVASENHFRAQVLAAAAAVYDRLQQPDNPHQVPAKRTWLAHVRTALKKPTSCSAAREVLYQVLNGLDGNLNSHAFSSRTRAPAPTWDEEVREAAVALLVPYPPSGQPAKLVTPKKKDLPPLPMTTTLFSNGECSISLDEEKRQVHWCVGENNRAVERAWQSRLGRAFHEALEQVKWVRGTGGVFRYSDEYSQDAAIQGGKPSVRIRRRFGPLGEQEFQNEVGYNPRTGKLVRRR